MAMSAERPASNSQNGSGDPLNQLQSLLLEPHLSALKDQTDRAVTRLNALEQAVLDPSAVQERLYPAVLAGLKHHVTHRPEALADVVSQVVGAAIAKELATQKEHLLQGLSPAVVAALSHQHEVAPDTVGQAIAPELAIAMRRQIEIEQGAIARELAPELGLAIKQQIRTEREAIIDALYPVIGSIISRYLAEIIQEINRKVEQTVSPEGISRKFRARIQGVSEAELLLSEAMPSQLQAIFLIHKASGLVMVEVQRPSAPALDADMVAGMLTAMRSFVGEYIAVDDNRGREVHEIEFSGDSRVVLEVAGYCYLALIVQGQLPQPLLKRTRQVMGDLIADYGDALRTYNGDSSHLPSEIYTSLTSIATQPEEVPEQSRSRLRRGLIGLLVGLLVLLSPLLFWQHHLYQERQLVAQINQALQAEPTLALYRVNAQRQGKDVVLQGYVPVQSLLSTAEREVRKVAPERPIHNTMVVIAPPANQGSQRQVTTIAAEVQRTVTLLNQHAGVQVTAYFTRGKVYAQSTIGKLSDIDTINSSLEKIPGVNQVINTVKVR